MALKAHHGERPGIPPQVRDKAIHPQSSSLLPFGGRACLESALGSGTHCTALFNLLRKYHGQSGDHRTSIMQEQDAARVLGDADVRNAARIFATGSSTPICPVHPQRDMPAGVMHNDWEPWMALRGRTHLKWRAKGVLWRRCGHAVDVPPFPMSPARGIQYLEGLDWYRLGWGQFKGSGVWILLKSAKLWQAYLSSFGHTRAQPVFTGSAEPGGGRALQDFTFASRSWKAEGRRGVAVPGSNGPILLSSHQHFARPDALNAQRSYSLQNLV
ncbi:hypothetical protein B0H16DRAFT_1456045 [Mycena metata]|uniref:Uncharacterized protein n=1 Tax=Mycena metata TaxID=1033252 RepID=A0AAD7NHU1_9AGAR|nr:hypothetical protein B0H16DRAFT_1456045 [Mycena metata]